VEKIKPEAVWLLWKHLLLKKKILKKNLKKATKRFTVGSLSIEFPT